MYEAFYSLEDPPFVLTPDPRFLLRSKGHHEFLAALLYGITSQKGLLALVGDVGKGKTVLVIVDEAQQMNMECLAQVRIISNLETPTRKLLQILLVGQPELEEK